jgi:hypothetical protein
MTNSRPSDWNKRRELILERDEYKCQNCGQSYSNLEVHHIVPLENGGSNSIGNLTTLCQDCHGSIHSNSKTAPTRSSNPSSKTASTQTNNSSSVGRAPSQKQRQSCPECTHSDCSHDRYDGRATFCNNCRTLWRYEHNSWDVAACPDCNSRSGFTWGERGGRLGSCNQCGNDFYPEKYY